jgi:hypothetical protein
MIYKLSGLLCDATSAVEKDLDIAIVEGRYTLKTPVVREGRDGRRRRRSRRKQLMGSYEKSVHMSIE